MWAVPCVCAALRLWCRSRKLSQAYVQLPPNTLPTEKQMADARMCGTDCYSCPSSNNGILATYQNWSNNKLPLDGTVGITASYAYHPEECVLINLNAAIKYIFDMPRFRTLTGGGCTFNGLRTWVDVAAFWSNPDPFPTFDGNQLLNPAGFQAMVQLIVNKQAAWQGAQTCEAQATQSFNAFVMGLRTVNRPAGVFEGLTWTTAPAMVDPGTIFARPACVDSVPLCVAALKKRLQGFAAITCDCSKLSPTAVRASKCAPAEGAPYTQANLNAVLSNTVLTQLPFRLGTPMFASCK